MTDHELLTALMDTLADPDAAPEELAYVTTFADGGVLTYNQGMTLQMTDGSEFQLTIVQSR